MPRYRATARCFVDNRLREEGEVFDYEGPRYPYLEALDKPAAVDSEPEHVATVAPRPVKRMYRRAVKPADASST